jgi:hypothetical protein
LAYQEPADLPPEMSQKIELPPISYFEVEHVFSTSDASCQLWSQMRLDVVVPGMPLVYPPDRLLRKISTHLCLILGAFLLEGHYALLVIGVLSLTDSIARPLRASSTTYAHSENHG